MFATKENIEKYKMIHRINEDNPQCLTFSNPTFQKLTKELQVIADLNINDGINVLEVGIAEQQDVSKRDLRECKHVLVPAKNKGVWVCSNCGNFFGSGEKINTEFGKATFTAHWGLLPMECNFINKKVSVDVAPKSYMVSYLSDPSDYALIYLRAVAELGSEDYTSDEILKRMMSYIDAAEEIEEEIMNQIKKNEIWIIKVLN